MSDLKKLGANIRSLRIAYGETQEQLGEAIFVEKNTISYYENGKREPNKATLTAIANHYMVSVGELLYSDLTEIGKITVDPNAFWKNIDIILPIISSEKALSNEDFKKAFDAHKEFYDQLHKVSMEGIDKIDICEEGYQVASKSLFCAYMEKAAIAESLWLRVEILHPRTVSSQFRNSMMSLSSSMLKLTLSAGTPFTRYMNSINKRNVALYETIVASDKPFAFGR